MKSHKWLIALIANDKLIIANVFDRLEILNKIQRNCADQIAIGGHFNNGGRFVDSAKKSIALCRPGQRRDIIRYACNFFAVNGGVVILK